MSNSWELNPKKGSNSPLAYATAHYAAALSEAGSLDTAERRLKDERNHIKPLAYVTAHEAEEAAKAVKAGNQPAKSKEANPKEQILAIFTVARSELQASGKKTLTAKEAAKLEQNMIAVLKPGTTALLRAGNDMIPKVAAFLDRTSNSDLSQYVTLLTLTQPPRAVEDAPAPAPVAAASASASSSSSASAMASSSSASLSSSSSSATSSASAPAKAVPPPKRVFTDLSPVIREPISELHQRVLVDIVGSIQTADINQLNRAIRLLPPAATTATSSAAAPVTTSAATTATSSADSTATSSADSAASDAAEPVAEAPLTRRAKAFKFLDGIRTFNAQGSSDADLAEFARGIEKYAKRFETLDVTNMATLPANTTRTVTPDTILPFKNFLKGLKLDRKNSTQSSVEVLEALKADKKSKLKGYEALRSLTFLNAGSKEEIFAIADLKQLEELDLTNAFQEVLEVPRNFGRLKELEKLRKLKINFPVKVTVPEVQGNEAPNAERQREIAAAQAKADARAVAITAISGMEQLTVLDLSDSGIDDADLMSIASLPLKEINLAGSPKFTPAGLDSYLSERKRTIKVVTISADTFDVLDLNKFIIKYPQITFKDAFGKVLTFTVPKEAPAVASSSSSSSSSSSASSSASSSSSSSSMLGTTSSGSAATAPQDLMTFGARRAENGLARGLNIFGANEPVEAEEADEEGAAAPIGGVAQPLMADGAAIMMDDDEFQGWAAQQAHAHGHGFGHGFGPGAAAAAPAAGLEDDADDQFLQAAVQASMAPVQAAAGGLEDAEEQLIQATLRASMQDRPEMKDDE